MRRGRRYKTPGFEHTSFCKPPKKEEKCVKNWEGQIRILAKELCVRGNPEEIIEKAKQNSAADASSAALYEKARMYLMRMI